MIKPLRKRHRQFWMAGAVLLPVGIILSWLVIPNQQPVKLLQNQQPSLFPVIVKTKNEAAYTVNLRSNKENTQLQLEWENKKALTVPSAVIYKIYAAKEGTENTLPADVQLIGRIEARGSYVFPMPIDSTGNKEVKLVLYDFIHQKIIDHISL